MSLVYLRNRVTGQVHGVDSDARFDGGSSSLGQNQQGQRIPERGRGKKLVNYYLEQTALDEDENLQPKFERVPECPTEGCQSWEGHPAGHEYGDQGPPKLKAVGDAP